MKRRSLQLVCLALLLSTLSLTDSPAVAQANFQMQCSYLRVLGDYGRLLTAVRPHPKTPRRGFHAKPAQPDTDHTGRGESLRSGARMVVNTVWSMRPPLAQYAALQSFTGFGRRRA
jgi:hypothetical protein